MKNQIKVNAEPGKQELFITREFDAPREMVFRAFTEPELLAQWYLPAEQKMRIGHLDYRTHGSYRFIMPGPDGNEVGISGVVHELLVPERIIRTFEYEGLPERGHVALEKILFISLPQERTQLTIQFICETVAYRDGLVNSGMETHSVMVYNKLDELLAKGF